MRRLLSILLFALAIPASGASLSWTANAPEEQITAYRVFEVIPRNPTVAVHWRQLGSTAALSFDVGPITGLHVYTVTAVNALRESEKSAPLFVRL